MDARCFLYSCILLLGLWGEVVSAQTFRRVKDVRELESGAHYVLAGYCVAHPDSLYVMASQDKTGTGKKNRAARKLPLDKNGRIHIHDGGPAILELQVEGKAYAFRDMALDAWLAYSTGSVSGSSSTGLYTLTDKELKDASTSTKKWYKTFEVGDYFVSGGKTVLLTKQAINTSTKAAQFHLALDGYGENF